MKKSDLLALFLIISACAGLRAQETPPNAVPVTLGQSVIALYGPWKFHVGDNPQWADPNFDDSQWESVDLTPTPQATVPGVPIPGFVAGWESRGHPGYAGYAWYRMRVRISGTDGPLTLLSPEWFDGAFQIFANGHPVGSYGKFNGPTPELYEGGGSRFALPVSANRPGPGRSTLIAFRFYMAPASLGTGVRGGMHGPPRIGLPGAATAVYRVEREREYLRLASADAAGLLYFLFALLIAMIFAFSRSEKILLWPLGASVFAVIQFALISSTVAGWMNEVWLEALIDLASLVSGYLWLLTWWVYFGVQRARWLFKTILGLAIFNLAELEFFTIVLRVRTASPELLFAGRISGRVMGSAVFLVMITIVWLGWKGAERRQWPLFLAIFFQSFQVLAPWMSLLHMRTAWQPFGVIIPINLISDCASLICFSFVLFGQFRSSMQRQQATEDDLKQAQEVQSLLIPRNAPNVPGWLIESEYRPARHVGGDFFQVLPGDDASLLIVVGDVSGKGLKAAMTVSAIVGALRGCAVRAPAEVLAYLNRVLHGQISGFATCAVASIATDGTMTVANAGHLSPYRNGKEMAVASGLPLGIAADTSFEETHFKLAPGDRLTFISDGVVEATNGKRELFGFERAEEISNQPAAAIAEAAQQWGQDDDITVLTVACTA